MSRTITPEQIIYLDNNATTCVDPVVLEAMLPYLSDFYGNPSSVYRFGSQVATALETAREQSAALINASPEEILFTSCGTESDNAAIASALRLDRDRPHVVISAVEHSAVIKQAEALARQGHPVTLVPVDSTGQLDLDELRKAVTDETAIVSIMWANNETGVLFPIREIAEIAHAEGALFHTDAVQVPGKLAIDVTELGVDFLSLSGHKLHCPKGVGVLYANKRRRFHPYLIGGGQEYGKRGGTENVASIVAFGKAAELAAASLDHEQTHVRPLRDQLESGILDRIPGTSINGDPENRLPNTTNIAFEGIEGEGLLILLDQKNICASAGSACTTGSLTPSHVLTAMGCSADRARSSLRFSLSRFNTTDEISTALDVIEASVAKLRSLRPEPSSPVAMAG